MMVVGRMLRIACASAHSALGGFAYRFGWHRAARRQFERVLLLRGADFRAYVYLGRIAFDLGDYAGWRRELEHARRTDPARFARLRHPVELFEPRLAGTRYDAAGDVDGFESTDARATWRAVRPFGHGSRGVGGDGFGRGDAPLAPGFDPLLPGQQLYERGPDAARSDPLRPDPLRPDPLRPDPLRAEGPRSGDPHRDPDAGGAALPDASLTHDDFASAAERRRFQLRRPIDAQEIARCDLEELSRRLSG